jgi:excisionase family DNA binding protein
MSKNQLKNELVKEVKKEIDLIKSDIIQRILNASDGGIRLASEFTTSKKAAEILGVSLPTLYKYTSHGLITRYRLGKKFYYRRDELFEAFEKQFLTKKG